MQKEETKKCKTSRLWNLFGCFKRDMLFLD